MSTITFDLGTDINGLFNAPKTFAIATIPENTILPLSIKQTKGMGSNLNKALTKAKAGEFSFLGKSLGSLANYIQNLTVIDKNTKATGKLSDPLQYDPETQYIVSAELKPADATNFRVAHLTLPYSRDLAEYVFGRLIDTAAKDKANKMDVIVEVFYGMYNVPGIYIAVAGFADSDAAVSDLAAAFVHPDLHKVAAEASEIQYAITPTVFNGTAARDSLFKSDDVLSQSCDSTVEVQYAKVGVSSLDAVRVYLDRFEKDDAHHTAVRAYETDKGEVLVKEKTETGGQFALAGQQSNLVAAGPFAGPWLYDKAYKYEPICNNKWLRRAVSGNHIPGFRGKNFSINDGDNYTNATHQYAQSSFPLTQTAPFIVAYPQDLDDIRIAMEFARNNGKFITPRSGGHQYCAKSSGGNDTIVLSLDTLPWQFAGTLNCEKENMVVVGPAVKLLDLTKIFNDLGLTVPHGECPYVCIGGHAQTGGYGHLARSFGLCMDRVHQFDIVLSDGRYCTVIRPEENDKKEADPAFDAEKMPEIFGYATLTKGENRQLFRSVLSGNAGSYGIITRYVLDCIRNVDYPKSEVYAHYGTYDSKLFKDLLKYTAKLTQKIKDRTDSDEMGRGVDFTFTVSSKLPGMLGLCKLLPGGRSLMVVEGTCSGVVNAEREKEGKPAIDQFEPFTTIVDKNRNNSWLSRSILVNAAFDMLNKRGPVSLSQANGDYVRKPGSIVGTTKDGREFDLPYRKRVNCTFSALNDRYIDSLVAIIDEVTFDNNVALVYQMLLGGGAYRANGEKQAFGQTITGIPHRDYTYSFVFDLFYKEGHEDDAIRYQRKMEEVVRDKEGFNRDQGGREARVFWGTFEVNSADETDISEQFTRSAFYDTTKQYDEFRDSKKTFDPKDLFHTSLTVRPAPAAV